MRIVGGQWGGRRLASPKGAVTRPTSDRVREALFSILEARCLDALVGGTVLDAFAGTGALGLEALSRGADRLVAVESDRRAVAALSSNAEALGATGCDIVPGDVFRLVAAHRLRGGPFSLLLLDPPYRIERAQVDALLAGLSASDLIQDRAVVAYEHASDEPVVWPEGFAPMTSKGYGGTSVSLAVFGGEPACRP